MSNIAFELEEKIMDCWNVTSEIKLVYSEYLDSAEIMTEDELMNIMIGIEYLYERKFKRLMASYEKICSHGGVFLDKDVVSATEWGKNREEIQAEQFNFSDIEV
jgi:hypothetical protein